jgi:hypothetical protein
MNTTHTNPDFIMGWHTPGLNMPGSLFEQSNSVNRQLLQNPDCTH